MTKLSPYLRRLQIRHNGCSKHDAPRRCGDCGRVFRKWHVHYNEGDTWNTCCLLCAEKTGAC